MKQFTFKSSEFSSNKHPSFEIGSLVDMLKGRAITSEEAERLSCSMLAGISFLHDTDGKPAIAHRDFKSTNVLIRNDMSVCIADYGLATAFEPDERIGDRHGQVMFEFASVDQG